MTTEPNILVAVPTMGSIHPILTSRLIYWGQKYPKGQIHFYFTFRVAPIDRARNQVVEYFLTTKPSNGNHFTHLFFIDSDTIPEPDALDRLLAQDKEVVSGLTAILKYREDDKNWETHDNCFTDPERDSDGKIVTTFIAQRHTGVHKLFRCGASCLLIKRQAFEKLTVPYFRSVTNDAGTKHIVSEDIYFCDRAREAGVEMYVDTDVIAQHYKDIML